jgi:hypothetical protein
MVLKEITLPENFWNDYQIQPDDIEYLYNHLLDIETPLSTVDLLSALIAHRIIQEKEVLTSVAQQKTDVYQPKNAFHIGQELTFPFLLNKKGKVASIRPGINPEYSGMEVIEVLFLDSTTKFFASKIEKHELNEPLRVNHNDPNFDVQKVLDLYGKTLNIKINQSLTENKDLVLIAGKWFPRSLLVDINQGHLNLSEAILEEANGGPLPISKIIEQADLPKDINAQLLEFSMDLALQEDGRFDEVGASGETLWFLRSREPEIVQKIPQQLRYTVHEIDSSSISSLLSTFDINNSDELEQGKQVEKEVSEISFCLIYPHWRSGTIPLTNSIRNLLPTAHEAPRVRFLFIDNETQKKFEGWVVRPFNYVYGLSEWYKTHDLIPGSLVHLQKTKFPGEVQIMCEKRKQNREWIRTALIGSDGGVVFAMVKQPVSAAFDERMALFISDPNQIDVMWEKGTFSKLNLGELVMKLMKELAKLNPQGQVHAQELYATVNLIRRCPPTPILLTLMNNEKISHLGDLYFKLKDSE